MKTSLVTALTAAALLCATWPADAQETASANPSPVTSAKSGRPQFITRGQRLTPTEAAGYAERATESANRVSQEPGGMKTSTKIWIAVGAVVVVGIAAAAVAAQAQNKLHDAGFH